MNDDIADILLGLRSAMNRRNFVAISIWARVLASVIQKPLEPAVRETVIEMLGSAMDLMQEIGNPLFQLQEDAQALGAELELSANRLCGILDTLAVERLLTEIESIADCGFPL